MGLNEQFVDYVWAADFIKEDKNYWKRVISVARSFTVARAQKCSTAMGRQESDD